MEGTECCERAILPEKALREKLNTVIEDEFLKVALRNTIKYFKPHSENDCVGATIKILEYSLTKKEVPKPYQTLLKEIRKDSPVSSWLPSYSQQDTRLLVTFLNQECDVFSDFGNVSKHRHSLTTKCHSIRHQTPKFPTPQKSYATIFFGLLRTLFWSN